MKRRKFLAKLGFGAGAVLAGKEVVKAVEIEPVATRRLGTYGAFLPNSPGELWAKNIVFNEAELPPVSLIDTEPLKRVHEYYKERYDHHRNNLQRRNGKGDVRTAL